MDHEPMVTGRWLATVSIPAFGLLLTRSWALSESQLIRYPGSEHPCQGASKPCRDALWAALGAPGETAVALPSRGGGPR
jgi:hypothetical protein